MPRDSQAGHRSFAECFRLLWRCQMKTTTGIHSKGPGASETVTLPNLEAVLSCALKIKGNRNNNYHVTSCCSNKQMHVFSLQLFLCFKKSAVLKPNPNRLWIELCTSKSQACYVFLLSVYTKRIFRSSTYHCCPVTIFHSVVREAVLFFFLVQSE